MTTSNLIYNITAPIILSAVLGLTGCVAQLPDATPPVITLTGDAQINLAIGDTYTEQGAICSDNFDASKAATVGGASVVTTTDASFIVTYNCTDSSGNNAIQIRRIVNVGADVTAPVIKLTGATSLSILVGSIYTERGAVCNDNLDPAKAATVGGATVITTAPRLFFITYDCTDLAGNSAIQMTRVVNVSRDATAPVITRTGAAIINLTVGNIYTEQGAICNDNNDASKAASVGGATVTTSAPATFIITYNCTDSAGNSAAQVTRTVNVTGDVTAPVITRTGSATLTLLIGTTYTEQGAICNDNVDASKAATIGGPTVITIAPAVFTITYNCSDAAGNNAVQLTRTVNIIPDGTTPVITRTGAAIINLFIGNTYTELGASCSDNIDTVKAATVGGPAVITTAPATFIVTYNCTDSSGNAATQVTRTVNVAASTDYGLTQRPSNTSCSIPDGPVNSSGYALTRVFPGITLNLATALLQSPVNSNRWYVAERNGYIRTFLASDTGTTVVADLRSRLPVLGDQYDERGLLGMVLHPNFSSNGYIYVYYSAPGTLVSGNHHSVLSRFTMTNETTLNLASEFIILQFDEPYDNHNGGNILFGPDGYLYIGTGDGGYGGDPENRSQNINSLLGKMLRIDVNNTSTGKNYAIPSDNPYAGAIAGADEIYALGLRNPWRWSFDRSTGQILAGDVGQGAREEIDIITRGGNYGWRCYEGTLAYNTSGCGAQNTYIGPLYDYDSTDGAKAVTGGYVYRGSAMPSLVGSYVFTDFYPGAIQIISSPYTNPVVSNLISNTLTNAMYKSSFAEDLAGEIYVLSYGDGFVYKITADSTPTNGFPMLLSQTGCMNTSTKQMNSGMLPYAINAPFWSDGAVKDRWFAIPDNTTISVQSNGDWTFPNNSVLIKNFRIGNQLRETRLLVKHSNGGWGGYSYEWNDAETDATYIPNGKTKLIGTQQYIYPSSSDCMQCHTNASATALGPKTSQMNRNEFYATTGITANQLDTLNHIGMFSTSLATASTLPTLTVPTDTSATLRNRARAYLYTNCSQCHRPGGGTTSNMDFNISTADASMNICNVTSTYTLSGATTRMVPGNANASTLFRRLSCRSGVTNCMSSDQMPPLGSNLVDADGATLISAWINSMSACP